MKQRPGDTEMEVDRKLSEAVERTVYTVSGNQENFWFINETFRELHSAC